MAMKIIIFESNKRKIKLKLPFHQIEGIATFDGFHYFLSNEHTVIKPINISKNYIMWT
jgi:hypothetical protein